MHDIQILRGHIDMHHQHLQQQISCSSNNWLCAIVLRRSNSCLHYNYNLPKSGKFATRTLPLPIVGLYVTRTLPLGPATESLMPWATCHQREILPQEDEDVESGDTRLRFGYVCSTFGHRILPCLVWCVFGYLVGLPVVAEHGTLRPLTRISRPRVVGEPFDYGAVTHII